MECATARSQVKTHRKRPSRRTAGWRSHSPRSRTPYNRTPVASNLPGLAGRPGRSPEGRGGNGVLGATWALGGGACYRPRRPRNISRRLAARETRSPGSPDIHAEGALVPCIRAMSLTTWAASEASRARGKRRNARTSTMALRRGAAVKAGPAIVADGGVVHAPVPFDRCGFERFDSESDLVHHALGDHQRPTGARCNLDGSCPGRASDAALAYLTEEATPPSYSSK